MTSWAPSPLPPVPALEWVPLFDRASGKTYFFCPQTGETSWVKPLTDEVVQNQFSNDGNFLAMFKSKVATAAEPEEENDAVSGKRKRVDDNDDKNDNNDNNDSNNNDNKVTSTVDEMGGEKSEMPESKKLKVDDTTIVEDVVKDDNNDVVVDNTVVIDYSKMTVKQLKKELKKQGLEEKGRKAELVARLQGA